MNKIPTPVLSLIFTMVGPIFEVYSLRLVCKNWKKVIQNTHHIVTFQRSTKKKFQPGNKDRSIMDALEKIFCRKDIWHRSLKLLSLDLRNVRIGEGLLSLILISQPRLQKLNLINCHVDLSGLCDITNECLRYSRKNYYTFNHSLEDLRISNHNFLWSVDYQNISITFINLKKLYAGNTNTSFNDFKFIIKYFKELEILDLSYCNELIEGISNMSELDLNFLGELKRLKIIFLTDPSLILEKALSNLGVKVIKNNIIEILNEIEKDEDLAKLNEWLSIGGEVNTDIDVSKGSKFYPQINFISKPISDELFVKAYKLMVNYDLDIYVHDPKHTCNSNIFSNFICAAAVNGKVSLFNYFIEHSFPIIKCSYHPNILVSSPKFLDVIINPQIQKKPKIPIEILYEAAQFFILKKNEIMAIGIIDYLSYLNFNEKEVLLKIEGSILLGPHGDRSLMSLAAEISSKNILKKLISNHFDINIQDKFGETALIYSSNRGNINILSFLYKNGALLFRELRSLESGLSPYSKKGKKRCELY